MEADLAAEAWSVLCEQHRASTTILERTLPFKDAICSGLYEHLLEAIMNHEDLSDARR